jgi:hypothetical protein
MAQGSEHRQSWWAGGWLAAAICALLLIAGIMIGQMWKQTARGIVVSVPNPRLTPGATVLLSPGEVCSASSA